MLNAQLIVMYFKYNIIYSFILDTYDYLSKVNTNTVQNCICINREEKNESVHVLLSFVVLATITIPYIMII